MEIVKIVGFIVAYFVLMFLVAGAFSFSAVYWFGAFISLVIIGIWTAAALKYLRKG